MVREIEVQSQVDSDQKFKKWYLVMLGITHLFPHNELVHLRNIAVAANTRAD